MLHFFGKRFYWIVFLWPVGLLAVFVLCSFPAEMAHRRGMINNNVLGVVFFGLAPATLFGLGLLLALARRRAGFSAGFLGWFSGLVVLQTALYSMASVWFFRSCVLGVSFHSLVERGFYFVGVLLLQGLGGGVAAILGGAIGLAVANRMIRTGRWETTAPFVQKSNAPGPLP